MELTLIKYEDDRILVLPEIKDNLKLLKDYAGLIADEKYKKFKANILYLISGFNYIPTEYWNKCKEVKSIKDKIENKVLIEVCSESNDETGKGKKKLTFKAFKELSVKEQDNILKETFDIRTLELFKLEVDKETDYKISKRIDEIREVKTDKTIGHPKDHLKTSGK